MCCRGPTATPIVVQTLGDCGDFGQLCTSRVLHSGGAASSSFTCSDSGVGDIEFLQERRHQDRETHDVAIIHMPQVCQASVFLQRVLRVVCSGKLLRAAKLEVGSFLHSGCVVCLQSLFF